MGVSSISITACL